jgi:predicted Zn-dependent protease
MAQVNMENMPKFVQEAYGTAQKRLTLLEGNARKLFNDTYTKLRENPSFQKVETTVDTWRNRTTEALDIEPIRKKVVKLRKDLGDRAADTIGVATKADIKSITRKINKLRSEVRKLAKK